MFLSENFRAVFASLPSPPTRPPAPHQDFQTYKNGNMPHANSKDPNQHTYLNAEIEGNHKELNGAHC